MNNKTHKKPVGFGKIVSENQMDKNFETRFGVQEAKIIKNKISISMKRPWGERLSSEKCLNMKNAARDRWLNNNPNKKWDKEKIKKAILKNHNIKSLIKSDLWGSDGSKYPQMNVIKRYFGNADNLAKELGISFKRPNRKLYLKEHPEVLKKLITNNVMLQKGKTLEQKYGKSKSLELKKFHQKHFKKIRDKNGGAWNKGLVGVQVAWNKDLTKYDHPGVMKYAKARTAYMQTHTGKFISSHEIRVKEFLEKNNIPLVSQYYVKAIRDAYLADFYLPSVNTIIEVDGVYWHNMPGRKDKDIIRTKQMKHVGYKVLRFTDIEINKDFDKVCKTIMESIKKW